MRGVIKLLGVDKRYEGMVVRYIDWVVLIVVVLGFWWGFKNYI